MSATILIVGNERVKESAFNLAESVLNSATNYLSSNWPTSTNPVSVP